MYFETAGITTHIWMPPLVAFGISFFTSMGGVSGAFLLLPFQMSVLGYTNPSVSATNHLFNLVAIPGGIYRYWREKRMVWPLTAVVIIGTLPGVFAGALIRIHYLPDPRYFKLFTGCVLAYIGWRLATDLLPGRAAGRAGRAAEKSFHSSGSKISHNPIRIERFDLKRLDLIFQNRRFSVPFWGICGLSLVVGTVGGIYGIGGGSIVAPFFVSFFGLPVYCIAGAALAGTLVTSAAAVVFYQSIAPFYPQMAIAPDWLLGALFGLGGVAGMYLGARCQKFVPARIIKAMLCGVVLFTAVKYMAGYFF